MEYESELEFCEYNPVSLQYEAELKMLAQVVEAPAMSFLQKLMKKIIVSNALVAKN